MDLESRNRSLPSAFISRNISPPQFPKLESRNGVCPQLPMEAEDRLPFLQKLMADSIFTFQFQSNGVISGVKCPSSVNTKTMLS